MSRNFLALWCAVALLASGAQGFSTDDELCACTACCHVDVQADIDFSGRTMIATTFPLVSLGGTYTLVDYGTHENGQARRALEEQKEREERELAVVAGTPYQYVIRYIDRLDGGKLLRNFKITTLSAVDCSASHVYWRAQTGLVQIPLLEVVSATGSYCEMDEGQLITRAMADNSTGNVYFAFNGLIDEGERFFIGKDSKFLALDDDTISFQYAITPGVTATQQRAGGEFYLEVGVNVMDIEQDLVPGPGCKTVDELIADGEVFWGTPACPAVLDPAISPSGNKDVFPGKKYTFKLAQSDYETCAQELSVDGGDLLFKSNLTFPTMQGGATCYYFQPGADRQQLDITVMADVSDVATEQFTQFSTELVSITPVRCEPISAYVTPQATFEVVIRATFAVTAGNEVTRVSSSIPYVSSALFELAPMLGPGNKAVDCVESAVTGGTQKTCTYYFKTTKCEKIYSTAAGLCGFEHDTGRFIDNLVFKETYPGNLFVTRRSPILDTGLNTELFAAELCQSKANEQPVDVTDTFPTSAVARNYVDGVTVDWASTTPLAFNDKIILKMEVGAAAATALGNIELFIKNVVVTLKDTNQGDLLITQFVYNVLEKEILMDYAWTAFAEDPIFCSYYNVQGGGGNANDKCQAFYDPFSDQTERWTPYNDATQTQGVINQVCQKTNTQSGQQDTRNTDYFMFNPNLWFQENVNSFMTVQITIDAVLHLCGGAGDPARRRALLKQENLRETGRELLNANDEILYVSKDIIVTVGADGLTTVRVIEPTGGSMWDEHEGLLIGLIVVVALLISCIVFFAGMRWYRNRKDGYAGAAKVASGGAGMSMMHNF
jgi:hypothetical protein